ncbi:MAG: type IV pili methyl-accepting chemotaxis transducer N-terminal domain-containing protein [Burkholderiaceae bacterium]|jgi:two-component system nitrate/nitrite sensor histidine kinase NarX|nr:type IV pili methyl-accepting chemotaxis transducer N-terminal domain-containing protein [Burkholderiaceae bacterium]
MHGKPSLSTKLLLMGVACLLAAVASIGFTLWVAWQLEGGAAAVNEAGRLRMSMVRMAMARQHEAPDEWRRRAQQFDASLDLLRHGDMSRPLFVPWNDEVRARYARVRADWQALHAQWQADSLPDAATIMASSDGFVHEVDGFVEAIESRLSRWTAILHLFQLCLMALAIIAAVSFMATSYWLVLHPVGQLRSALERMRRGHLDTRMPVEVNDEFGQLAAGFNLMAQSLQSSHGELEDKVREKTASLNEQHLRLQALYAVSVQASEAGELQALAQGFVRQIRMAVHADAATVRWSDEANERYVLLAGDGLPQSLSVQEHCLHTGACLCGQPREQARLRVIPITPASDIQLPHCREAGFETVVSIPVQQQQRLLGEVNLFFRGAVVLTDDLRDLLSAMARHLASAMESLRATALEREAAVAEERGLIARELHDSIAQSLAFLKIQTQLLRDAVSRGNADARERSLSELEVGVRECYADVRELLVHFRTRTRAEDIEAALRATLSKFEHQTGISTCLAMSGQGLPLAPDVQIQVLHMVQEALSNVRKHAGATRVDLRVGRHPWRFEVCDDGCGFDPGGVVPDSLHVGLGIMRERALLVDALVHVHSRPGAGTRVLIELPPSAPACTSL